MPLPSISFQLRMPLLHLSWCVVTDCKQQLQCELDLSQLSHNAILHSYPCGTILNFCRGEELCHFPVFSFHRNTNAQLCVQLQWRACHAILTSSSRTVIAEKRVCSLHTGGKPSQASWVCRMARLFLSRHKSRQRWRSARCWAVVRAQALTQVQAPLSATSFL